MKIKIFYIYILLLVSLIVICTTNAYASYPVTNNNNYAFISNYIGNTITIVDVNTNETINSLNVNSGPSSVAVNKAGTYMYVSCARDNSISVFDVNGYSLSKYITLPYAPLKIDISNDGTRMYVICGDTPSSSTINYIVVIDTSNYNIIKIVTLPNPVTIIPLTGSVQSSALTGDDKYFVVIDSVTKYLIRYDTTTWNNVSYNIASVHPSSVPSALSSYYDNYANGMWVICNDKTYNYDVYANTLGDQEGWQYSNLTLCNTGSILDASSFGVSTFIYIGYSNSNNVTKYKGNSYIYWNTTIPGTYGYVRSIQLNNDGTKLYVVNSYDNKVYVLDTITGNILGYMNTGTYPVRINIYPVAISTNTHSTTFTVQSLFGAVKYQNINVTIYDESSRLVYTGITGLDGAATFILNPKIKYTITFINNTQDIDTSVTLYPTSTLYYIDAGLNPIIKFNGLWHSADINQSYTFNNGTGDPLQDVTLTVSQSPHTVPTSRTITATYNDDSASTGSVNFSLYKANINNHSQWDYVSSQAYTLGEKNNMLVNGGFETGDFSGWTVTTTAGNYVYVSSYAAHDSQYSAYYLTINSNATSLVSDKYSANVAPGQIWCTTMYMKGSGTPSVFMEAYDNNGGWISNVVATSPGALTNEWKKYTFYSSVLPANTAKIGVAITTYSQCNFYVDDITLSSNTASCTFALIDETQLKTSSNYKIVSTSSTKAYGTVERVGYASWDGTGYLLPGLGLDNKALPYTWICFGVVFLIVIIGTYLSNGIIIFIAGGAWEVMIAMGWMTGSAQNFALGALVMAIGAGYVLMQKRREMV